VLLLERKRGTSTTCVNVFQVSEITFVNLLNKVGSNSRIIFIVCNQRIQFNNNNINYIQEFLHLLGSTRTAGKRISFVRPFLSPDGNTNSRSGGEKNISFRSIS